MDDRNLNRRLSQRLRAYESRLPDTDAPGPRGIRPRGGIRWPAVAGVLGAAVVVAAVGGAAALLNRPPTPAGSAEPTVSGPPESTNPTGEGWQLETLPDAIGPVQINDIALLPDGGAIVVGADARAGGDGTIEPAAWFDDGAGTWQRAKVAGSRDAGDSPSAYQLGPVVATDDGLVSIGIGASGAVIYTSSDSGASWVRQFAVGDPINESGGGIDGFVLDVQRGPNGYVAVGHLELPEDRVASAAMIWRSADALHWQPVGDALGVGAIGAGAVTDLAVGVDRLVAVGSAWDEDGTHPRSAVWSSADGQSWTEIGPGIDMRAVSSVVATTNGFLLGGAAGDAVGGTQAAAWFSRDGEQWESAALKPGRARGVSGFAATASGFVAIGDRADHAAAWWSRDGQTWTQASDMPTDGRSTAIAVASLGDTVLVAGTIEPGGDGRHPAVWRTSTPPGATPGPSATPTETPTPTATAAPLTFAITWAQAADTIDDGHVRRVVADGGKFYALGGAGRQDALAWASDDGQHWRRMSLPYPASWPQEPHVDLAATHLVSLGDRLVAFGRVGALDNLNAVVWQSTDGGASWTEVKTGSFMTDAYYVQDATAGPEGIVVATHGFALGTGSAWRSTDGGATWAEHRPGDGEIEIRSAVGTSDRYLLAGNSNDADGNPSPRLWTSPDGVGWRESSVEGADGIGAIEQVTVTGSGAMVATGWLDGRAVAWRPADGERWDLAADLGEIRSEAGLGTGIRLIGLPSGALAIDPIDPPITWMTADGGSWERTDQSRPAVDHGAILELATGIARVGDTIVIGGNFGPEAGNPANVEGWFTWRGQVTD